MVQSTAIINVMKTLDMFSTELCREGKNWKIILWTVNSGVWPCKLWDHKNTELSPTVWGRTYFFFRNNECKVLKAWTFDLINFKLLTLTNPSDLSIKKNKTKQNMPFQFGPVFWFMLLLNALKTQIPVWLVLWWRSMFLYYLEILVYLPVWEYLHCTEFPLREMGENNFLQNMTASSLSSITTCLMGCNSIFIVL